jgi:hypothetical protein
MKLLCVAIRDVPDGSMTLRFFSGEAPEVELSTNWTPNLPIVPSTIRTGRRR